MSNIDNRFQNSATADTVILPCPGDHCTVEERAVVEAAAADRLAALDYCKADKDDYARLDRMIALRNSFFATVDALLTARKEVIRKAALAAIGEKLPETGD